MKTTIDLPEELVREMKSRAVQQGRKLRDVAAEIFRRGLNASTNHAASTDRHRFTLPLIPAQEGAKPFDLSGERLLELESGAQSS